MAADRIAALEGSLNAVAEDATEQLVLAGCQFIGICASACATPPVQPTPRFLASCAQFLLRCGAAVQRFAVDEMQQGNMDAAHLSLALTVQFFALDVWQQACSLVDTPDPAAVAEACAPPALLRRWLQQTLASLQALEPPSWRPGGQCACVCAWRGRTALALAWHLGVQAPADC